MKDSVSERSSSPGKATSRDVGAMAPGGLRRKLVIALLLTAATPFIASMILSERLAEESLSLGLNPRLITSLDDLATIYPEFIRSLRALAEARADLLANHPSLASDFVNEPQHMLKAQTAIQAACNEDESLRSVMLLRDGSKFEIECEHTADGHEEAAIELERRAGGNDIRLLFALDETLVVSLEEAEELARLYSGLDADRAGILRAYRRSFLILLGGWIAVAGIVGLIIAGGATRRVEALAEATRRVSAGDLSSRVEISGKDELAELGLAFNEMVEELRTRGDRIVYLEKISSWQEMARRLAHEIKNPLTPIQLAMQQLENRWQKTKGEDPQFGRLLSESVEIVREEIDTLGRLVGEFSAFARLPDVSPEPTDLVAWSQDFIRTHPDLAEQAAISYDTNSTALLARLDRSMMRRVLANLVQNAIDAAEGAGTIPRVRIAVEDTGEWARLRVSDQGPGMPPEILERIFDPYFTTKETGTGLGLTICKKIVLQHGGTMAAAAPPSGGAIFDIHLPKTSEPASTAR